MTTANNIVDYMFLAFGVILLLTFAACMVGVVYSLWTDTLKGGRHD